MTARCALGSQGLEVSRLGLGCMGMSFAYGAADEDQSLATLHRALDLGVTFLDTADMYGPETNERLLARVLRERRNEVELATKFGFAWSDPDRVVDGRPTYARRACDDSLRRLGVDEIDLYYLHRVDPDVPIEETVGAMSDLVTAGKVRYIGLSEATAETLRRAHTVHPLTALQTEYSLWTRDVEPAILPTCRELGIGFVAYSPIGRGFLTGAIRSPADLASDDRRREMPRFTEENARKNAELVRHIEEIAEHRGSTAAQVALAWLLQRGDDVVPIPATTKPHRVQENAAAAEIELTADEVRQLETAFPPGVAVGERYAEAGMRFVPQ